MVNDQGAYGGPHACGWLSNEPRVIERIADQEVDEEKPLSFKVTATDPDIPPQTLTFSLVDPPEGATVDPTRGLFNWYPSEARGPGTYPLVVQVQDDSPLTNGVSRASFTVKVNEVNQPPLVDPVEHECIHAGVPLRFRVAALDLDRPTLQTLAFTLDGGAPEGAAIAPATGEFAWVPTGVQARTSHVITVRVTDNGSPPLSSTVTFEAGPPVLSVKRGGTGGVQVVIECGGIGVAYTVQAAAALHSPPDAIAWTTLKTVTPSEYPVAVDDPEAALLPYRFYRLVRTQ